MMKLPLLLNPVVPVEFPTPTAFKYVETRNSSWLLIEALLNWIVIALDDAVGPDDIPVQISNVIHGKQLNTSRNCCVNLSVKLSPIDVTMSPVSEVSVTTMNSLLMDAQLVLVSRLELAVELPIAVVWNMILSLHCILLRLAWQDEPPPPPTPMPNVPMTSIPASISANGSRLFPIGFSGSLIFC